MDTSSLGGFLELWIGCSLLLSSDFVSLFFTHGCHNSIQSPSHHPSHCLLPCLSRAVTSCFCYMASLITSCCFSKVSLRCYSKFLGDWNALTLVSNLYRVGKLLGRYRSGKLPKAFKIIPSLSNWEEIMYLTDPEKWSPNAMYQATRVFASNFNARMAQRFYSLVLLPRIRQDIKEHKRLHFALYQSLKKAVYKPSAFYKGVLLPLCQVRS